MITALRACVRTTPRWGAVALLLTACSSGDGDAAFTPAPSATVAQNTSPGFDPTRLDVGDCLDAGSTRKVPCDGPAAASKVTSFAIGDSPRYMLGASPQCPGHTDGWVAQDAVINPGQSGDSATADYACYRNLSAPHPGDPGQGGGNIVAGDCLAAASLMGAAETLDEVACPQPHKYKVVAVVGLAQACPGGSESFSIKTVAGSDPLSGCLTKG